uniref:Cilia- and flagella-associated protein 126 n=1 Tax=Bombyx mori TaxID=7091 RepID=A0A8R2DMX6_BOMMO|nr:protein Flattop [Bombyx mori]
MAFNFDSGQFNKESTPKRLGNWEVPRWAPSRARPLEMRANPKPICDINGRFLPGAPRGTSRCFGHFTGTWDLPRKITRKVAEELAKEPPDGRFSDWLNPRVQRPKAAATASGRLRGGKRAKGKEDVKENGNTQTFVPRQCPFHSRLRKVNKSKK